ncbi:MAG TPA: hypothetical protein PK530_24900, partial [Anaerolineales bacterium]|nr:hypothetical protein [Anaerolineales bacterium]
MGRKSLEALTIPNSKFPIQNSKLLPLRLYYFFTGTSGFLLPFLSLFYVDRGLSGTQIGWLGTIGSLTA